MNEINKHLLLQCNSKSIVQVTGASGMLGSEIRPQMACGVIETYSGLSPMAFIRNRNGDGLGDGKDTRT